MAAGQYDILIEQGATFNLHITYQTNDKLDIDLRDGWLAKLDIRGALADKNAILELSTENGKIILGNGFIDLNISAAETADLPVRMAVYDLKISTNDISTRLMMGAVSISGEVTK